MIEPAIIVIAYNREKSLSRLLKSIAEANYSSDNITLHISIDASENRAVKQVADDFEWKYGEKVIDLKATNIGLLKHVLECGELTNKYESIIVLEDDLYVAPNFYNYAIQANDFYAEDEKIAGVSLYTYSTEENNFYPFEPIREKGDVHFIQVASSWGQSWNKTQWSKFIVWLNESSKDKESLLPDYILNWGSNSWKKLFINYLIDTDRYFVFPNTSYSTNFEDEGTHASNTGLFQVQLNYSDKTPHLLAFLDSNAIYDAYFELKSTCLKKLNTSLSEFDFEVDIYGEKPIESVKSEYILSSRLGTNSIKSFGARMKPLLQNVLAEIEGAEIGLYRKDDLLLTEEKRFLTLNSAPVRMEQYLETRKQKIEHVTVVIPVLDDEIEALKKTIEAMSIDRFYNLTVRIVCSAVIDHSVKELTAAALVKIEIITSKSQNTDDILRFGIASCSTDYCSWIQPGMTIDLSKIEYVARIFQSMSQVQILHGLQEEVTELNSHEIITDSPRWTPQLANLNKNEAVKLRSELVFWRKSLLSDERVSKLLSANLFVELLTLNPIYLVMLKLGDINDMKALSSISKDELEESLSARAFQPKRGFRFITRPIFHYFFRRNVTFFRMFYRESEHLPRVIRYDFTNDSFYFDNY